MVECTRYADGSLVGWFPEDGCWRYALADADGEVRWTEDFFESFQEAEDEKVAATRPCLTCLRRAREVAG